MMRTIHVVKQHLATAFFVAIGLMASGCGDVATVTPEVELAGLTVGLTSGPATLQPAFSPATTNYTVSLSSDIQSVTVTALPAVSGDSVTINGQATTNSVIPLNEAGKTTVINVIVSESTAKSRTYTVVINRAGLTGDNSLQNLTLSPGTLPPPGFNRNTLNYSVDVANNVESVSVTPTLSDSAAKMTVNGQAAPSGQPRTITLGPAGQTTNVTIVVTAQNGNPKTYLVTVSRGVSSNNNLQSLTLSPGTLNFRPNITSYTVNVASNATSVVVTPRLQDATASMTVNGQSTNSSQARTIPLGAPGSNTIINIVVIAQNGTQRIYSVNVIRAALGGNNNLSALTVSPGTLTPAFSAGTEDYTVHVGSTVTSVRVTPRVQDTAATTTVNGQGTNSGQARTITLNGAGSNTLVNIAVTAPNGSQKTYSVNVIRAALGGNNNLRSLTVSPGILAPAFRANRTGYSVSIGSNIDNLTVTATLEDAGATVMINGQGAGSGQSRPIPLEPPGSTTEIAIIVVAPNGNPRTYQIDVNREALGGNNNLSALTVSPGTLAPAFNANTTGYTVNVGSAVTSINVSATKVDSNAVMSGSVTAGTGVATGQAAIPLNGAGTSTLVSVTVTAPNGSSKTYSINVNRAAPTAPPAPASAPDLTPESDSGFLPGQDADNITNDLTPSFTVAPPAAGETPSLYIDGVKVKEGFDQGANTLTPMNPLPGGEYDITVTSTVTNAAGLESLHSPSLSVHIDNVAPGFQ
ncbi:MAG: cadherin-like beta sandwich domain-containing protein [Nitrospira sp.]|nr:cadherin-like beta sandwich domain-containing protein [Nitrospira sp.]